jgi:predicted nucleic acid-binding protein
MIVVVDTSVLGSGLLSAHGAPARVLGLPTTGDLQVAYDGRIAKHFPAEMCTVIEVLAPTTFIERWGSNRQ